MTVSISRCCRRWASALRRAVPSGARPPVGGSEPGVRAWGAICRLLIALLLASASAVHAGSIEPVAAAISPGDDGYVLSAEFRVELGARLEEAVARGVPLYFNLEFTLERNRWYWLNEPVAGVTIHYRLAYNALTRQYRLSFGSLHQSFSGLAEALQVISRTASLPVADKGALKAGETYAAAVRLSLDRNQLPKPFQVDAISNRDWQVDARTLRWQFVHGDVALSARPTAGEPPAK